MVSAFGDTVAGLHCTPHNMHFIWPELLWLLLLIPLLVVGYIRALRRKRTMAVQYPSLNLIRPALGPGHRIRRHIPPALLLCAVSLVLLGAARPSARLTLPADYLSLVLAMDVSRSMLAEDVPPSRIVAAQQAAKSFVQELPAHVRVAVVSFAGNAQLVQGVTDDKEVLLSAIDGFQLQRGTATGSGLLVSLNTLWPESAIDLETVLYGAEFKAGSLVGQGGGLQLVRQIGAGTVVPHHGIAHGQHEITAHQRLLTIRYIWGSL